MVLDRILAYNQHRDPRWVTRKYAALTEDPFRFFRGTCRLFYEDLRRYADWDDPTRCWITGDLHLENFGTYRGSDDIVYFDLNDFDEARLAPASWELARLLTSIYLGAEALSLPPSEANRLSRFTLDTYMAVLRQGKPWVIEKETATGLLRDFIRQVRDRKESRFVRERVRRSRERLRTDETRTFRLKKDQRKPLRSDIQTALNQDHTLRSMEVLDVAWRLAGTGSVGLKRYVVLVREEGRFRLVDLKEAVLSSLENLTTVPQPVWADPAGRITAVQEYVQHKSPALLRPLRVGGTDYVMKELQPSQDRMDLRACKGNFRRLQDIIGTMARLAASGILRSGGRNGSSITDELIAFGEKKQEKPLLRFARESAERTRAQYHEYVREYQARHQFLVSGTQVDLG